MSLSRSRNRVVLGVVSAALIAVVSGCSAGSEEPAVAPANPSPTEKQVSGPPDKKPCTQNCVRVGGEKVAISDAPTRVPSARPGPPGGNIWPPDLSKD